MAYQVGAKIHQDGYNLIHLKQLKRGTHAYIDQFWSVDESVTNRRQLVIVKTPITKNNNRKMELEEATLTQLAENCEARGVPIPVAKLIGHVRLGGKHLLVLEAGWLTLDELLLTKEQPNENECLALVEKILTLVTNFHTGGFIHGNLNPNNFLFKFPSVYIHQLHIIGLLDEAIEKASDVLRPDLVKVRSEYPLLEHEWPAAYPPGWDELVLVLTNVCSATPVSLQFEVLCGNPWDLAPPSKMYFQTHPIIMLQEAQEGRYHLPTELNFSPPEAILRGFKVESSDVYGACLIAARVCLSEPLIQLVGLTKKDQIANCLRQMISLKGPMHHCVLNKCLDSSKYFVKCKLACATENGLSTSNIKTILNEVLVETKGWSIENFDALYTILSTGLKHNTITRGSFEELLTILHDL